MANVFEALAEIYEDSVKEQDENGYADAFKSSTELFFKCITEELTEQPLYDIESITFEDVEYLDGYFIFGRGTNSVVHFHIKECPGWKFGIWWDTEQTGEKVEIIGKFFTQFEKTIDKFKPSRSEISGKISFYNQADGEQCCSCFDVINQINFIIKEPYLAFCRDYCMWDYNCKYHTREEAKARYDEYVDYCERNEKYTAICDEKIVAFIQTNILPLIDGGEIEDRGDSWIPRYKVIAPFENYNDCCKKPGSYSLFDIAVIDKADNDNELLLKSKQLEDRYNSVVEECRYIAEKNEIRWSNPMSEFISLYSKRGVEDA